MMSISAITENSWDEIMKIQAEAYTDIVPEEVSILKSKWLASPATCAVYVDDENKILGYLLAHPWGNEAPPKLHEKTRAINSSTLYLHDLALANAAKGKKIAKKLVENLITYAKHQGFSKILLVSVQSSNIFWGKFGFIYTPSNMVCPSYGDDAQLMVLALKAE